MPRREQLQLSLAIAWLIITTIIIVDYSVEATVDQKNWPPNIREMVESNRRTIGELFDGRKSVEEGKVDKSRMSVTICDDSNVAKSKLRDRKLSEKSLSGPRIFQDPDNSEEYNAPHVRVKRISNFLDSPFQKSLSFPIQKSIPFNVKQRRVSRRMFKRFAPDESIAADENEADYSNGFSDNNDVELDIDIPGGSLNDEITNKRNSLEDIYPEVKNVANRKGRITVSESLKSSKIEQRDVRRKRVGDAGNDRGSNQCIYGVQNAEQYYDEEDHDAERKVEAQNDFKNIRMPARENLKLNQKNVRQAQVNKKPHVESKEISKAPLVSKSTVGKKSKSVRKEKSKTKPTKNELSNNSNKKQSKEKPKTSAAKDPKKHVTANSSKHKASAKSGLPKVSAAKSSRSNIREQRSNEAVDECVDEEISDVDRSKRNKEIVFSYGSLNRGKKSQMDQKAKCYKISDRSEYKIQSKAGQSIGELKDLMGKLIVKIEDLRDIVSEMKSNRDK